MTRQPDIAFTPGHFADYADAGCCALLGNGKRCGRAWKIAMPCTWGWDPTTGEGVDGPYIVFCGIHRRVWDRERERAQREHRLVNRIHVDGGWFGPYNQYNYGSSVFASQSVLKWKPAKRWWRHRRSGFLFGRNRRDAF